MPIAVIGSSISSILILIALVTTTSTPQWFLWFFPLSMAASKWVLAILIGAVVGGILLLLSRHTSTAEQLARLIEISVTLLLLGGI